MAILKTLLVVHEKLMFPDHIRVYLEYLVFIFSFCILIHLVYSLLITPIMQWKEKSNSLDLEPLDEPINTKKDND